MERSPARFIVAALALALLLQSAPSHAFTLRPTREGAGQAVTAKLVAAELLTTPLRWLLSSVRFAYRAPSPPANSAALRPEYGWNDLRFEVGEHTVGVFLEVAGRVEFDRAELEFEDGETETVDLGHRRRGRGLYELASFDEPRGVREVRVHVRADDGDAWLGVRLGR